MSSGIRGRKRDILRRLAAFGPVWAITLAAGCSREASPTVVVPMIPVAGDDALGLDLDAGRARDGGEGGSSDAGVVELEPSPPKDAFACRRDVACRATPTGPKDQASASSAAGAGAVAPHLPSPFERCPLHDADGRAFSARETRDARLTDPARCCYVSFVDCVRGAR